MKHKYIAIQCHNLTSSSIVELYEDFFNNFLTVPRFAEYYRVTVSSAQRIINLGKRIRESNFM